MKKKNKKVSHVPYQDQRPISSNRPQSAQFHYSHDHCDDDEPYEVESMSSRVRLNGK